MSQINSTVNAPTEATSLLPEETQPLLKSPAAAPEEHSKELVASRSLPLSRKVAILAGTQLAVLLASIDMSVVAALHSSVASTFDAAHESSWMATSYLWASLSLTPMYGRLSEIIGRRAANALAISLFLAGTVGCAIAPNMLTLVVARFIAGTGGGGLFTTSQIITADLFSVKQRGLVSAISTGLWALGGALGGPIGGFVADYFGWRVAFAAQVPLIILSLTNGLVSINYPVAATSKDTVRQKLARIDFLGCALVLLSTGSLLVLLSLKNAELRPWSDPRVVTFCVLAPLFLVLFITVEHRFARQPILDFSIALQKVPALICSMAVVVAVCNFGVFYSLPEWFIAVQGTSVSEAGAHLLAISVGTVIGGGIAGVIIHRTGTYRLPILVLGILPVFATLNLAFLTPQSSWAAKWLGVLPLGIGFGTLVNATNIAIMAAVPHRDIPVLTGFLWLFRSFGQLCGVALTASILQSILAPQLEKRITGPGSANVIRRIRENSATIAKLPEPLQIAARSSFAVALRYVFLFCTLMAFLSWAFASAVPQVSLDDPPQHKNTQDEQEGV